MTFGLDTDILIYALDPTEGEKRRIALWIVSQGVTLDMVLATQVLGEYLNVARRKITRQPDVALDVVGSLTIMVPAIATTAQHGVHAGTVSGRHDLRYWDALIIAVYRSADVGLLLTEDLQDGQTVEGVEILDPFKPANAARLEHLLAA